MIILQTLEFTNTYLQPTNARDWILIGATRFSVWKIDSIKKETSKANWRGIQILVPRLQACNKYFDSKNGIILHLKVCVHERLFLFSNKQRRSFAQIWSGLQLLRAGTGNVSSGSPEGRHGKKSWEIK